MPGSILEPHEPKPPVAKVEEEAQLRLLTVQIHRLVGRIFTRSYDYSTPVDEYEDIEAGDLKLNLIADYAQDVKYEGIAYSLPLGITSAILQIGNNRKLTLYNGPAITVQTLQVVQGLGMIVGPSEDRVLTLSAGATSSGHINLFGHAFERNYYR